MRQLILDISPPTPPTLDNFVAGKNAQLLATLRQVQAGDARESFITLWGHPGSGRHHLLQALAGNTSLAAGQVHAINPRLTLVYNVMALNDAQQHLLFIAYNQVREQGGTIIVSTDMPPLQLTLREDLRTRLGWGLVFQVHELSDEEKTAALLDHAQQRGIPLAAEVVRYLLTHYRRDMPSLMAWLDALDRYALEKKRAITLPLVRELLSLSSLPHA